MRLRALSPDRKETNTRCAKQQTAATVFVTFAWNTCCGDVVKVISHRSIISSSAERGGTRECSQCGIKRGG